MAHEFTMPKLGLTMTDGTIREWLVADGSKVNVGDAVLVIETDKVETEVEAREAGVLSISGVVEISFGDLIDDLTNQGPVLHIVVSVLKNAANYRRSITCGTLKIETLF